MGRADLLVVPPSLPVERLRATAVDTVQFAVILGGCTGQEELRLAQQRFDRLTAGQQRCKLAPRAHGGAGRAVALRTGTACLCHSSTSDLVQVASGTFVAIGRSA
jgi:hypothetical protein